jgi:hypothetical protein
MSNLVNERLLVGDQSIYAIEREIGGKVWPEFMRQDKEINAFWPKLYKEYLNFQFALFEGDTAVGVANALAIYWDEPFTELPDRGLDWSMEKALDDLATSTPSNLMVGIQILINSDYTKMGLSYKMLQAMKEVAKLNSINHIALPLRPTLKSKHPTIPMEKYITWQNEDGLPYDPWIRVHLKSGGEIVGVCNKSMLITGNVAEWTSWTNKTFEVSGQYEIDDALAPITIDLEEDTGVYLEPNVWVIHTV